MIECVDCGRDSNCPEVRWSYWQLMTLNCRKDFGSNDNVVTITVEWGDDNNIMMLSTKPEGEPPEDGTSCGSFTSSTDSINTALSVQQQKRIGRGQEYENHSAIAAIALYRPRKVSGTKQSVFRWPDEVDGAGGYFWLLELFAGFGFV
ncbi:hypothetical protein BLNAU_10698 [Blattamonas nauphoetae]|uniref:Uncharacterized protein n=1 Tax=Blattamonas nauphoetae TaxID=2049346 RepID=A0ABQ9XPL0_9EUKA|nr:hypothetical protein BLNAU_10698 [Blattamonas nauphoetae]